jgi:anti-anti-sigma factor
LAIEVLKKQKGSIQLAIRGEMTIYSALEQKQQLAEHFKSPQQIQIDLAGVTEIDSAGLQLLMFYKQKATQRGGKLTLVQHSEAVVEVLELLDLSTYFGDPIVISADWKSS